MKKGLFGMINYIYPKRGILPLLCSANENDTGDVTLLIGVAGSGKTTLSVDPKRKLIGDDEHAWTDTGIFNLNGGCYAKILDLNKDKNPEIVEAIRFGSILENAKFSNPHDREINYHDTSLTPNLRACYPISYMSGFKNPATGKHPKNMIILVNDHTGVLPPVSRLNHE
jgi:phosphoenolpyruvate carboxykinase (ATP)